MCVYVCILEQWSLTFLALATDFVEDTFSMDWVSGGMVLGNSSAFQAPKSLQMVTAAMKLKDAYSLEGKL